MKNILKMIQRFTGIVMLSFFLLLILNVLLYFFWAVKSLKEVFPEAMTYKVAEELVFQNGKYSLSDDAISELKKQNAWAMLIDDRTKKIIWHTDNLPNDVPKEYTISDVAVFSRRYLKDYPVFSVKRKGDLFVVGFPKMSYWRYNITSKIETVRNIPFSLLKVLIINLLLIFFIYMAVNSRLLNSLNPLIKGIKNLSDDIPVNIKEKGLMSELSKNINKTSIILQKRKEMLQNRETARANWIAGVSHDIRTPLSIIIGYADQLKSSENITAEDRRKLSIILKQGNRIKSLVNDLNLASKLEYNMQPVNWKMENAVVIARQVAVNFLNMNIDEKYPVIWNTEENFNSCIINADRELLKRALENLIQNSINHNENGCKIYISVREEKDRCVICVEDDGTGISNTQMQKLSTISHYMICDTNTKEQRHGLGLLIVKQIMEVHDGDLVISHSEHGGFKAELIIPEYTQIAK